MNSENKVRIKAAAIWTAAVLLAALTAGHVPGAEKRKSSGYLGVNMNGTTLARIIKGSAAEKAGLKVGDVILEVDGKKIESATDLLKALRKTSEGETIDIKIRRRSLSE